jgi:hypothetical protein
MTYDFRPELGFDRDETFKIRIRSIEPPSSYNAFPSVQRLRRSTLSEYPSVHQVDQLATWIT